MSTNQPAPAESALTGVRAEFVSSSFDADGIPRPPTDPAWNRYSDYIQNYPGWGGDAGVEGQTPAGTGDIADHFRGPEEHDLAIQYWMQRFFLDSSGNPNDPIGALIDHTYGDQYPCHEVLIRNEVTEGGLKGAGFREYIYGSGCRPSSGDAPGDPSASNPVMLEAGYACEKVRQYIIHQPATSVSPQVASTSDQDTTQTVTVESEDGSTTDTFELNGTTKVSGTGSASFSDIDAIWVDGSHEGDIQLYDGNGNELLEDPITGSNTDGVEADRGIPLLGSGSHSSEIGTDPENYLFLGTSSSWDGGALAESSPADRVHALDLSVEVDISREPRQGTRRKAIDVGPRNASADADLAGPYESAKQNQRYYTGKSANLDYTYPDGTVTLVDAPVTDTDDVDRDGGDSNILYGVTFEGHGDGGAAITASHS